MVDKKTYLVFHSDPTFTRNPIPAIAGYELLGYFEGPAFAPPTHVYTPGTSYTKYPVAEGNNVVFYVYKEKDPTVTVSKEVTGKFGDVNKKFDFTVYFYEDSSGTIPLLTLGVDGVLTFQLAHGESETIEVPKGAYVKVVETAAPGYLTSFVDSKTPGVTESANDTGARVINEARTFAFTNDRNEVPIAGVDSGSLDSMLIMTLLLLLAVLTLVRIRLWRRAKVYSR